jgi:cytochrome P450
MEQVGDGRSVRFDYMSSSLAGPRFWDAVAGLQRRGPLVWVDSYGGFWAATSHDMVVRIAQDWQNFTSTRGAGLNRPSFDDVPPMVPIEINPPRHRTFRKTVNPALTVRTVSPLEEGIRAIADELIDAFIERGSCDITVDFARKFPGTVFFRLIAHSADEEFAVVEPASRQISFEPENQEKFAAAAAEMRAWAGRLFAAREESRDGAGGPAPSETDAVDAIMSLADSGGHDSGSAPDWADHERMSGLQILVQGGIGTSASAISSIVLALCQDRGLQERVRGDLSLIPGLMEEILRSQAPVPLMFRTATRDVELAGQTIRAGDKVCMMLGAAGRDPAVFDHPGQIDLDRPHCRHLTFGAGIHRCIGSNLARLQIRVAIEQIVTRLEEFRVPGGAEVTYYSRQQRGVASFPLVFSAAGRQGGSRG